MPYACICEGSLINLSEPFNTSMRANIRCLLLGTSKLDGDDGRVAGAGELASCRHIYILSYQTGNAGRPSASSLNNLKLLPLDHPPFFSHVPSRPLCIHKAIIWTRRSSVGAQGFPSAFLWQRGTTAYSRNTSKSRSQRRCQALPTVVTRHRRFCGCIPSISDGCLAAIRSHSCMLNRTC